MTDSAWEYPVELRHLRAFVAVAEELHFGRAAIRLHHAQPALTKQIQQLEMTLGVKLLDRSSRNVTLTPPGVAFLEEARRALGQARRAVDVALRSAHGETGLLRIGFSASAPMGVFPHVIRAFRQRHPDVRLELTELWSADQVEALLTDRLDVGFGNEPATDSDQLARQVVQEDPIVAAVPAGHELVGNDPVRLRDLAHEPFLIFPRATSPAYFDQLIAACHRAGFSPRFAQEVMAVPAALGLVAAGLGISLLPGSVKTLQREGVSYVEIADTPAVMRTVIVWRDTSTSVALRRFLEVAEVADETVAPEAPAAQAPPVLPRQRRSSASSSEMRR